MLIAFFNMTVKIGECNIVPTVDVDLLNVRIIQIGGQERVFRHLAKQSVRDLLHGISHNGVSRVIKELCDTDDRSVVNLFRFQNLSSLENKIPKHKPARQKRQHGKSCFVASAFHLIVDQVKYDGK